MTFDPNHHLELADEYNLQLLDNTLSDSRLRTPAPYLGDPSFLPTPESTAAPESPMASLVESDRAPTEVHICPDCGKQFNRNCDLNKHAKSHTRPFKCLVPDCKYFELGWPTAKELDRHNNDKHSLRPQTYPCHFQDCTYRSKRESNCKQHMEKAHGWTYVKSKTNGKRVLHQETPHLKAEPNDLMTPVDKSLNPYPTPRSEQQPVFAGLDFPLFDDTDPSILGEDDEEALERLSPDENGTQAYLPWNSPMTRLRMTENFLERFSETYNSSSSRSEQTAESLIDPRLSDAMEVDIPLQRREPERMFPRISLTKPDLSVVVVARSVPTFGATGNMSGQSCLTKRGSGPPLPSPKRKRDSDLVEAPSGSTNGLPIRHRRAISGVSTHSKQLIRSQSKPLPKKEDESDEEEMEPPKKKKRASEEEFSDNNMPDIFRFAHPEIYHRDKKEKYSPCHSDHKDISTLVRHLSRPAHRLQVTERLVSSFEIDDNDYIHPRVGVCRRCWTAYNDRQEFDSHVAGNCAKVSKGKKEKWRILHDAFTPIVGGNEQPERPGLLGIEDAPDDAVSVHASAHSPMTIELSCAHPDPDDRDFVPMAEYQLLRDQVQQYQQLINMVVQQARLGGQGALVEQAAALVAPPHHHRISRVPLEPVTSEPAREVYHHHDIPSDRGSLLGGMDSQSTDVDPQGLMEDVKTLSRANSGLEESDSRSKLHHVPTEDVESVRDGATGATQSSQPHPTSNPDSGYHTHSKRPSYAQDELDAQIKVSGVAGYGTGIEASSSALAAIPSQQHQPSAFPQTDFDFFSNPPVDHLPLPPQHEHDGLKSHQITNEPVISDAMWDMMRDPFAGAGSSQAASQAANMATMGGAFTSGHLGEDHYYQDLVDFDNDLMEHT